MNNLRISHNISLNKYKTNIQRDILTVKICCFFFLARSYNNFRPIGNILNRTAELFIFSFRLHKRFYIKRRVGKENPAGLFAKRWCVSLTRRRSETDPSVRKFILPRRGCTRRGRNRERERERIWCYPKRGRARATASHPRCQGYAWTINGPGCNQRDYKRCSRLTRRRSAIINVRQIGQPCFCK